MLGVHVLKDGNFKRSIDEAVKHNLEIVQIFVHNPRGYGVIADDSLKKVKVPIYVHLSYVDIGYFNDDVKKSKRAQHKILDELRICDSINARGAVLHIPKKTPDVLTDKIVKLTRLMQLNNIKTPILIENNAVKFDKSTSYALPEQLNTLCEMILKKVKYKKLIGICIDTAHLHVTGADISSYESADKWFKEFKYPNMIKLFHLNDAESVRGSGKDKHDFVGNGKIWKDNDGYKRFLEFAVKNKVGIILERNAINKMEMLFNEIYLINSMLNKIQQ